MNGMVDITRERMREAIKIAKAIIAVGRTQKVNVTEAERLLSEAVAASYRLDFRRALNLAEAAQIRVIEDAVDDAYERGVEMGRSDA